MDLPGRGPLVWSATHESNSLGEWYTRGGGGEFNSGEAAAAIASDVAHSGRYAASLTIRTPPDSGTRLFRWRESTAYNEAYYGAWFYLPAPFRSAWNNIFQFKSELRVANDPFWFLQVANRPNGAMYLMLTWHYGLQLEGPHRGERGGRDYRQSIADVPVGRWTHIEVFLRQSASFSGRLIVWQDGVQLFDQQDVRTKYEGGDQQWSVNHYASDLSPSPSTIYVDDAEIHAAVRN